jgi:hypothetical protein
MPSHSFCVAISCFLALLCLLVDHASAVVAQKPLGKAYYTIGQSVPVSCMSRETDTGEHKQDKDGVLQYVPFPTCNETNRPLELKYGIDQGRLHNTTTQY